MSTVGGDTPPRVLGSTNMLIIKSEQLSYLGLFCRMSGERRSRRLGSSSWHWTGPTWNSSRWRSSSFRNMRIRWSTTASRAVATPTLCARQPKRELVGARGQDSWAREACDQATWSPTNLVNSFPPTKGRQPMRHETSSTAKIQQRKG